MISIWVFVAACLIFIGILINERLYAKELRENLETLQFYLDQYVSKYGPTIPITLIKEEEKDGRKGQR